MNFDLIPSHETTDRQKLDISEMKEISGGAKMERISPSKLDAARTIRDGRFFYIGAENGRN